MIFCSYFSQKTDYDIFHAKETVCMKNQSLFSGKSLMKKYFKMESTESFTHHAKW